MLRRGATEYTTRNQALIFSMIKRTKDFDVKKNTINDLPPQSLYFSMNLISFMFSQPENLGRAPFKVSNIPSKIHN